MTKLKRTSLALALLTPFITNITLSNSAYAEQVQITSEPNKAASITVKATGTITHKPDTATITLSVRTLDKSAQKAISDNEAEINKMISDLKSADIDEKDIETTGFNIQRIQKNEKSFLGKDAEQEIEYIVTNTLSINITDLKRLGKVLDKAEKLDKNASMKFFLSNSNSGSLLDKARENAGKNARKNAEILVQAASGKLGRILEMTENQIQHIDTQRANTIYYDQKAFSKSDPYSSQDTANRINANQIFYSVDVTVTFEITE